MPPRLHTRFAALALACATTFAQAQQGALPDLGQAPATPAASIRPAARPDGGSVALEKTFDGNKLVVTPEFSSKTGTALGATLAMPLADDVALGLLFTGGANKNEFLANGGFSFSDQQRLVLSLGQLRQKLEFDFASGKDKTELTQNSGALSYQQYLGSGLLNGFEINAYRASTASRNLADKTYAIDTAALYELWNDRRRVAGGQLSGLQGRLVLTPFSDSVLKLGFGGERLAYDLLAGSDTTRRGTASAEWTQRLDDGWNLKLGLDAAAAQDRYAIGLEQSLAGGHQFGVSLASIHGRLGAPGDNQLRFSYSYNFGGGRGAVSGSGAQGPNWTRLLDQVAQRPGFIPAQVVAKRDTTATPQRLIAVDKTALPAGSSVATATGVITAPLGVAVTTIAGVTLNGGAFANAGQFALAGNSLLIYPAAISQPAVGATDTYVVTVNNAGGGTTLVTVGVRRGSVWVERVVVAGGAVSIDFIADPAAVPNDGNPYQLSFTAHNLAANFASDAAALAAVSVQLGALNPGAMVSIDAISVNRLTGAVIVQYMNSGTPGTDTATFTINGITSNVVSFTALP